jgi:hypothetical protein
MGLLKGSTAASSTTPLAGAVMEVGEGSRHALTMTGGMSARAGHRAGTVQPFGIPGSTRALHGDPEGRPPEKSASCST